MADDKAAQIIQVTAAERGTGTDFPYCRTRVRVIPF